MPPTPESKTPIGSSGSMRFTRRILRALREPEQIHERAPGELQEGAERGRWTRGGPSLLRLRRGRRRREPALERLEELPQHLLGDTEDHALAEARDLSADLHVDHIAELGAAALGVPQRELRAAVHEAGRALALQAQLHALPLDALDDVDAALEASGESRDRELEYRIEVVLGALVEARESGRAGAQHLRIVEAGPHGAARDADLLAALDPHARARASARSSARAA